MKVIAKENEIKKFRWNLGDVIKYGDFENQSHYASICELNGESNFSKYAAVLLDGYPMMGLILKPGQLSINGVKVLGNCLGEGETSIPQLVKNFEANWDFVEKVPFYGVEGEPHDRYEDED